jgi:hypothetical protein
MIPSPQRRLGPRRVKNADAFTPWDASLRWHDGKNNRISNVLRPARPPSTAPSRFR